MVRGRGGRGGEGCRDGIRCLRRSGGRTMSETLGRPRIPDGLFVRQPRAERERGVPLVGVLFLLTRTSNPQDLAERLATQLAEPDELKTSNTVIPLWADETDAWFCDAPTWAAVDAALDGCTVVGLALVPGKDADRPVYELMPAGLAAEAMAALRQVLRDEG
jgi:hypothetical protein